MATHKLIAVCSSAENGAIFEKNLSHSWEPIFRPIFSILDVKLVEGWKNIRIRENEKLVKMKA